MLPVVLLETAFCIGSPKLTLESRVDHILYRQDAEKQIPVAFLPVLRREKRRLGFDQSLPFEQGDILPDRVPAHADSGTDGVIARVAGVRLPILAPDQKRIDQNLSARQSEVEDSRISVVPAESADRQKYPVPARIR